MTIHLHQKAPLPKAVILGSLLLGATTPFLQAQDNLALPPSAPVRSYQHATRTAEEQAGLRIRNKLGGILVPRIEFRATTLNTAVEFLRQEGARLDPEPGPPETRGVNFILRLPVASQTAVPAAGAATESGGAAPAGDLPTANTRITLSLSRIPLLEALKYVAAQAGLKIKVEPYAVLLVPLTENTDTLITRVFRVPPDLIGNIATVGGGTMLDQPATAAH